MADEASVVNVTSTAITDPEASTVSIGALIQDFFHSDNAKVNDALDALDPNRSKDNKERESIVTAGGFLAFVQVVSGRTSAQYSYRRGTSSSSIKRHARRLSKSASKEKCTKTKPAKASKSKFAKAAKLEKSGIASTDSSKAQAGQGSNNNSKKTHRSKASRKGPKASRKSPKASKKGI
jgi:hypothetical protein